MRKGMCTGLRDAYISFGARLRRVREPAPPRPVQGLRRVSVQPADADPLDGCTHAGCIAGDDRPGVLRRPRRGAALRAPGLARLRPSTRRSSASRWHGRCRRSHCRSLDADRRLARACAFSTRSHPSHRRRAPRRAVDGALHPTDVRERDDRVVAVGARDGCARGDLRRPRRPELGDPTARRHRGRLGGAVTRDVGARSPGCGLTGGARGLRGRAGERARAARGSDDASAAGVRHPVRPVLVRLRLTRPERVRPALGIVGGQAADRAVRDRPDAQVRRVELAGRSRRVVGRRGDRVAAEIRAKVAGDAETAGLFEAALRSTAVPRGA